MINIIIMDIRWSNGMSRSTSTFWKKKQNKTNFICLFVAFHFIVIKLLIFFDYGSFIVSSANWFKQFFFSYFECRIFFISFEKVLVFLFKIYLATIQAQDCLGNIHVCRIFSIFIYARSSLICMNFTFFLHFLTP